MKHLFLDCEQGTKAWFDARLGCVTSSRVADVIAKRKRVKEGEVPEELACRRDMRWEIVGEFITNKPTEHYVSRWMKEGKEREPQAREEYAVRFDRMVETVGFAYHPTIKSAGASPDGIVYPNGLLEIKCPKLDTHLQYMADEVIPAEYVPQLLWQLACVPDAEWIDFVSFHPDPSEDYQLFVKRLSRSGMIGKDKVSSLILAYECEVETFNEQVQINLEALKESRLRAIQEYKAVIA